MEGGGLHPRKRGGLPPGRVGATLGTPRASRAARICHGRKVGSQKWKRGKFNPGRGWVTVLGWLRVRTHRPAPPAAPPREEEWQELVNPPQCLH